MSLTIDIAKFAKKTKSTLDQSSRAIKINLFSRVIGDTRVREGRLKGNWQTSARAPIMSTIERLDPDGSAATAEAENNVTPFGVDYMTNNLPYAEVYEEKDGMVKKNMARIARTLKESVK